MLVTAQEIAYRGGWWQRCKNTPRSESIEIADFVYSDDYSLRRIMLEGYDARDSELAAEMS